MTPPAEIPPALTPPTVTPPTVAPAILRSGLIVLTVAQLPVGLWALFAPHAFYDGFPTVGHAWVALLPPYNEHLVRDVGAFNLALAVVLGVAAVTLERRLTRVALAALLVYVVPHTVFHATHLETFPAADAVAQTALTALHLLLVAGLLALTWRRPGPANRAHTT